VALVGDDEIEALDRDRGIVGDEALGFAARRLEGRRLLVLLRQLLAGQRRIDPLDGGDDDLGVLVEPGAAELLDIVDLVKRAAGAGGR
jgi:hypothetical protein